MQGKYNERCLHGRPVPDRAWTGLFVLLFSLPIFVLLEAGCGHHMKIVPASTAVLVSGQQDAAEGTEAGVRIEANGNSWEGHPYDLARVVTPMEVWIKNDSGKPLRIRYKDVSLTLTGFSYHPLPPYKIRGGITRTGVAPAFGFSRFYLAPYYGGFYSWDFDDWGGPFAFDWDYYPAYYAEWQVHLPTGDMIRKAIPEGVLESGGNLSGFLYFHKVDENKRREGMTFSFDLVDAKTQERFGTIAIPFLIE